MASFNDTAVLEPANHYSVSIAWGDGNTSAGTLTANGSGGYAKKTVHVTLASRPNSVPNANTPEG